MEIVRNALLFIHLVGMASLLGGALVQLGQKDRIVNLAMEHGAGTQLVSGILLVGTAYMLDDEAAEPDNVKIAVKAVIAIAVLALCLANRNKRPTIRERVFFAIFGLTLINIGVAVFWL